MNAGITLITSTSRILPAVLLLCVGTVGHGETEEGAQQPGTVWRSPSTGMQFVYVPAGRFLMGSPVDEEGREADERQHEVTISRPFFMGKFEVTREEWTEVMGTEPWLGQEFDWPGDDLPAIYVSWHDAVEFAQRLNSQEDTDAYRLPTEAEWEYAARAGTLGPFAGDLDDLAWYGDNSGRERIDADALWNDDHGLRLSTILANGGRYHAVGTKSPNAWGLHDMHGNVWEWVRDWLGDYPTGSVTDPQGALTGEQRALRGGSWSLPAHYARSASRDGDPQDYVAPALGFRLVREVR